MNLNHLTISGNLTRDPEMRSVGADKTVVHFTVANSARFKGQDGEQREEVTFLDCDAWGRQGEIAAQYLQKGSPVIVEGGLRQDNWTDKDGQKRSKLKMRVDKVHLMPRSGGNQESDGGEGHEAAGPATRTQPSQAAGTRTPAQGRTGSRPVAPAAGGDDEPPF